MPNLGVASHPTIHADPPSGGSTPTEPNLQRHPYTNEAKNELCQIQKYLLKLKNGQLTILGPTFWGGAARAPSILANHTNLTHTGQGQTGPNLKLKSRSPIVGKRWSLNLHSHSYANTDASCPFTTHLFMTSCLINT